MLDIHPQFPAIEQAWWEWVDQNCPNKSPRARGKWMSANVFSYDGTTWERSNFEHRSNSGKSVVHRTIIFSGKDGRAISNGERRPNRRSDPNRNWGLPE